MRPRSSTSDAAWLDVMLAVEAALARVHARRGTIDAEAAAAVAAACAAGVGDAAELFAEAETHATPVVGLVERLRRRVPFPEAVHLGATSQDVIDTAAMLLARQATDAILADTRRAAGACAALAEAHRAAPIMARTLLQPARPTTFGLKAATWLFGIDAAAAELARVPLPVQLAGPVGHGDPALAGDLAEALGLDLRPLPWQADRTPVARLAAALGVLAGALAKPCRDVILLAQGEVAEVAEPPGGASSSMPHKDNPAAAVGALASAHRVPGLVATLLAGMAGEHERAAGAWQAERLALGQLLDATGDVARLAARSLSGLRVDAPAMAARAGADPDLGHADTYVDRALAAHEEGAP